jgi:tetratricopeptide (TPR) repeat protein
MMKSYLFAIAFALPAAAHAACPTPPDHAQALSALSQAARAAPSEADGRALSDQMWELWLDAPDAQSKAVLDLGMRMRESYHFLGALGEFTRLIEYCPDYAEGYNQRAFTYYMRQDFVQARADLDAALALSPTHVGALSGRALTLMQLGETDAARADLQAALALNPWLSERHLLAPGAPLDVPGEDI